MTESVRKLKALVDGTDNIVFFGGAGVSTESGIPDFRSTNGLYHQEWKYPPEVILSHTFYKRFPAPPGAPENRPSVMRAQVSDRPIPSRHFMGRYISGIPGPPLGPS